MKGIAGIVYPDVFVVNQSINPMLRCLQSTPNEGYGFHVYKNIEIGTCSSPLFCNEKQNIYVGLAGFLDNSEELRTELKRAGYPVTSNNDEEIIVRAYEYWGKEFLIKIQGSFAIAVLDQREDLIMIARDSTGKKPLYWYQDPHHFIFSTQLKALLATGFVPQTPAPDGLAAYLYFGYSPQDITPIKNVNKLLPGYYLELKSDGSKQILPYWSYSSFFEKKSGASKQTIVKHLEHNLSAAVKMHLPKDHRVGCFVSGGLGSATVAYYLHKMTERNQLEAFSVGFQEENEADINAANEITKEFGIPQKRQILNPSNFLNDFARIMWHLDEPIADPNVIATWHLSKLAAGETNVVYSGMGSDELFAGHSRYTITERANPFFRHISKFLLPPVVQWIAPVLNVFSKSAAFALLKYARKDAWYTQYLSQNALFSGKNFERVAPKLVGLFDPEVFLSKFHHMSRIRTSTSTFLYFDVKTRLADLYILQYEKLTSANNLTWYSPFLNRSVVEFAASLPEPENLTEKESALYLKAILENLLPSSVLNRPKKTRPEMLSRWVDKSYLPQLFKKLRTGSLVDSGYISEEWLREATSSTQNMTDSFRYLWAIFALEVWFRLFINKPVSETPPDFTIFDLFEK